MKRVGIFCLAMLASCLIIAGCSSPLATPPSAAAPELSIPVTAVSLSGGGTALMEAGQDLSIGSTVTPADNTTGVTWSSSNTAAATVSQAGVVHGVAAGTSTITLASTKDPSISASLALTVAPAGSITSIADKFTFVNQAGVNADSTQTMPLMMSNKLTLNNSNADSLVKSSVEKNSMIYFNTAMTGDFKFKARVKMNSRVMSSADRGVTVAAYSKAGGEFGTSTAIPMAGMMFRARGDVRSYYHTGSAYSAGSPNLADYTGADTWDTERVLEVKREAAVGYTFTIYTPKTNAVAGTAQVLNAALAASVTGTSPVYLVLSAGGVTVEFANIEIWDTIDPAATVPVYASPTVAASPVALRGISVSGPSNLADATYEYQNAFVLMSPKTLQLTAVASPSYADNTAVSWSSNATGVATVDGTGLVTVAGPGIAAITATSAESGFTARYDINISNAATPVTAISLSGSSTLMAGLKTYLVPAFTPSNASIQALTWASDNTSVATVNPATGVVSALAAGSAVITATATDGTGVQGTFNLAVTAFAAPIWTYNALSDAFTLTAPTLINGKTVTGSKVSMSFVASTGLVLANNRFIVGSKYYDATTSIVGGATLGATTGTTMPADGEFNFTKKAKLSISYTAAAGANFTVYLNNNTTGDAATNSMIFQAADAVAVPPLLAISSKLYDTSTLASPGTQAPNLTANPSGTLVYTIDPAVFTKNPQTLERSFLQFRISSTAGTTITITGITVEYLP